MTYSPCCEQPASAAFASRAVEAALGWLRRRRAARRQRLVLAALLEMDPSRLEDLGICHQDVIEAIANPRRRPGELFAQRRSQRSEAWLRPE